MLSLSRNFLIDFVMYDITLSYRRGRCMMYVRSASMVVYRINVACFVFSASSGICSVLIIAFSAIRLVRSSPATSWYRIWSGDMCEFAISSLYLIHVGHSFVNGDSMPMRYLMRYGLYPASAAGLFSSGTFLSHSAHGVDWKAYCNNNSLIKSACVLVGLLYECDVEVIDAVGGVIFFIIVVANSVNSFIMYFITCVLRIGRVVMLDPMTDVM